MIGRQKRPNFFDRLFSSLIDTVIQKSPSEVAVLHGEIELDKIKNILLPFGSDIHSRLAAEIAPALMDYFNARLRLVVVIDPDMPANVITVLFSSTFIVSVVLIICTSGYTISERI